MQTMRVLARGKILVLDAEFAKDTGHRRYVGRKTLHFWNAADLPENEPHHHQANTFLEPGDKAIPHTAYPKTTDPVVVLADRYYTRSVAAEELWAADEATARLCNVAFDPSFGGEYPSNVKAVKASKVGD